MKKNDCIKMTVVFHANNLENQKMAWVSGEVHVVTNRARGIRTTNDPIKFSDVAGISPAILRKLKEHGVVLVKKIGDQTVLVDKCKCTDCSGKMM